MATELVSLHRFTDDEFRRMAQHRIVPAEEAELVDGQVVVVGSPWQFSTDDYYRLLEIGVLTEDSRVELIHGEIRDMAAIGSKHAACVRRFCAFLARTLGDAAVLSVQSPLRLDEGVEPEPDIALLRPHADFYAESHPTAADVLLLIEVADTSLGFDRGEKADLYATAGVAEYWLADLNRQRVLVHVGPTPAGFARIETMDYGATWTSQVMPQLTVTGKDIFGE